MGRLPVNEKIRANDQNRMLRLSDKSSSLQALFWAGKPHPDPFFSEDCSLAARTQDALVTQTRGPAPPSISQGKI